jgi:hypothetical protein
MTKGIVAAALVLVALPARAQDGLATLIPGLFGEAGLIVESEALLPDGSNHSAHFNSDFQSQFTQFNVAFASQLAAIPLPSPAAGFTYRFDPALGIFERTTESFGPIFGDRAETIGRGKVTLSTLYQRFSFDTIEGVDLGQITAVFTHDDAAPGGRADVVTTRNAIEASVDQFVLFATYGVTDSLDVSVVVPVVTAELTVTSDATVQRLGTASNPAVHFFEEPVTRFGATRRFVASDSASGIGDVIVRVKGAVLHDEAGSGLALGVDTRLPTGDEQNLLGSGSLGLRPFAAYSLSRQGISPHLNVAYQWNGASVLGGDVEAGIEEDVPDQLQWTLGIDAALSARVTAAADLLGRRVIDSPRLVEQTFRGLDEAGTAFPNIAFETGSFNELSAAFGLKINVGGQFLFNLNLLVALDDAGLRDEATPMLGFEYTF